MNEYTRKNSLRLQGYDYSKPGTYFITICAKNGEMMFGEVKKACMVLNEYGAVVKTILERTNQCYSNLTLEAYAIMPNHIHLLIRIPAGEHQTIAGKPCNAVIPTFVRTMKTLVTKQLQFSPWQGSYNDVARADSRYDIIKRYIENNPATWDRDRYYETQK